MAHPMNNLRDHKVQHSRVKDITAACGGGMAKGGDVAQDKAMISRMVKKSALRATGGAVTSRADRPARAWGGRLGKKGGKKKGKSGHTVNVIVAPHSQPAAPAMPPRPPMAPPGVAAGPPMPPPAAMAPRPPVPPGPMGGPPGVAPPPGIVPPMRKSGGKVTSANAGIGKGRTTIQRDFPSSKQDTKNIGRGSVITKATGGPISSPAHGGMGPKLGGGARGGKGRLAKTHRLSASGYGKATAGAQNPTRNPHG